MAELHARPTPLQRIHPRSLKYLSSHLQGLVRGRLWLQVLVGMVLGLGVGLMLGPTVGYFEPATSIAIGNWLAFPGQLFLALIQMIVIPLVFASIIRGLAATEDFDQLKKMGLGIVLFFVGTTGFAIVLGIWLTTLIRPGDYIEKGMIEATLGAAPKISAEAPNGPNLNDLPQQLITLLPANPMTSMVESNMLQIVVFAGVIGTALVMMRPSQSKPLLELMGSLQEVCMTVVRWAMALAPFAVFGLLAQLTAKIGVAALLGMAVYVLTVLAGLFIVFLAYLLLLFLVAGHRPTTFVRSTRDLLLLAFSTSSSAAVMPMSIKTAEEKLGVRPSVSQFVIPIGATLNMNGTALYQGVAAIFLAQVFAVDIGPAGMALIVLTAVGASIGSPATPGVGIVILAMVLSSVGIPTAGIALIMGVDRILDMSRTVINVTGDLAAAVVMNKWVGGQETEKQSAAVDTRVADHAEATGENVLVDKV